MVLGLTVFWLKPEPCLDKSFLVSLYTGCVIKVLQELGHGFCIFFNNNLLFMWILSILNHPLSFVVDISITSLALSYVAKANDSFSFNFEIIS